MELRTLRYFLMVSRLESISEAARALHITQPTLSRQMAALEEELGTVLFERGNRSSKLSLTEKGMLLRRRAEEIISLSDKTEYEIAETEEIRGEIHIGAAETVGMKHLVRWISLYQKEYPNVRFHFYSGDGSQIRERLEAGLDDLGIIIGMKNRNRYESLVLPHKDRWGVLLHHSHPLAKQPEITVQQLRTLPIYLSKQVWEAYPDGAGTDNVRGTYNLLSNAVYLAEENLGAVVCLEGLAKEIPGVVWIPLQPVQESELYLVWKKYHTLSPIVERFLDIIRKNSDTIEH
ncbi:MAG: LysR family transcriptional regulator [Erysipelotrichaceae bacterium]|nr:LysR family transcriptional regulator [Erysipelotrichaceae bacterium]